MSHHTKIKTIAKKQRPPELLARVEQELIELTEACRDIIEAGNATPALVRELAGTYRALIFLAGEKRQQLKHATALIADMKPEEIDQFILAHIAGLPPERLVKFREAIFGSSSDVGSVSVLG